VYAEADVPVSVLGRFSGVNPHPHTQLRAVGPLEPGEGTLAVDGCRHRVLGASEGDEERVALGVDLVSAVSLESLAEQSLMLRERLPVQRAEPLQQAGRSLDVREEKGDGAGGPRARSSHGAGVLLRAACV
jgi:hypothetical protein